MENLKDLCVNNSASILTGLGVVGVIGTAVVTAKLTPKALDILEEREKFKQDNYGHSLTRFEKVLAVTPTYMPAILIGLATCSCIIGSNRINQIRQASLMSAYTYLDSCYKEYQRKVKEVFGEDGEKKVMDELSKEVELYNKYGSLFEKKLFYDEISKRYFEMSMYEIKDAEYKMNRMFNFLGCLKLNEVYEFFNLKPTDFGDKVGWSAFKDWECVGFSWIQMSFEEVITNDGIEALKINFDMEPSADYYRWND